MAFYAQIKPDTVFATAIQCCGWINYEIMKTLIIVIITGMSWLAVILMIKALEWVGFRALRCCLVCLGLTNWPIRCWADPHMSTPSASVPTRGGRVCLSQAYYSKIDQASFMQLWPSSPVAVWNVWHRPPPSQTMSMKSHGGNDVRWWL